MSLRLEGHIILWLGALLSVGAVVTRPAVDPLATVMGETADALTADTAIAASVAEIATPQRQVYPRSLPDPTNGKRTLFAVRQSTDLSPEEPPALTPNPLPVLKGVISDGGVLRSVFSVSADPTGVVTVGVAGAVAGYRVDGIETDQVVLASPTGEAVVLRLRGQGESP